MVVTCVPDPTQGGGGCWSRSGLVGKCRLGTAVRKDAVLAYLDGGDKVCYQRLVRCDKDSRDSKDPETPC